MTSGHKAKYPELYANLPTDPEERRKEFNRRRGAMFRANNPHYGHWYYHNKYKWFGREKSRVRESERRKKLRTQREKSRGYPKADVPTGEFAAA